MDRQLNLYYDYWYQDSLEFLPLSLCTVYNISMLGTRLVPILILYLIWNDR